MSAPASIAHRFRMAMAARLGQILTPAVAAAIEAEVFAVADAAVPPARFAPAAYGAYTIQVESFREVLDELTPLHLAHWQETEKYRHGLKLDPDYEQLFLRERMGRLVQFTVRTAAGELVGHLRMFLVTSVHTQTPVSEEDTLFIRPDHRGSFLVMGLLRYAERVLVDLQGHHEIRANSKAVNRADVLMRRMGYALVAYQFSKFTGENP